MAQSEESSRKRQLDQDTEAPQPGMRTEDDFDLHLPGRMERYAGRVPGTMRVRIRTSNADHFSPRQSRGAGGYRLRGLRESGTIFALPTYFFVGNALLLIVVGVLKILIFHQQPPATQFAQVNALEAAFLIPHPARLCDWLLGHDRQGGV